MSVILAEHGETRRGAGGCGVRPRAFCDVLDEAIAADGANASSYAHRLGWPVSSLQNYLGNSVNRTAPDVERLVETIRRGRMPAGLHLGLMLLLADGRFLVSPAEEAHDPAAPADQANGLRALAIEAQRQDLAVAEEVHRALLDGHVDEAEAQAIQLAVLRSRDVKSRLVAGAIGMWQRCRRARS